MPAAPPPAAPLEVRPATPADLAAVTALDARAYGGAGYGPYVVRQLHDLSPSTFLVAVRAGAVVGYCACGLATDGVGWVLSLATDPEVRRVGVARALSVAAIGALEALAPREIRLTVAPDNTAARALYAALGFVELAAEADYYGPGQDRLVLGLTPRRGRFGRKRARS